jgi:hypothetical protein
MWLPFGMKDSKGKAKELSQWESDLRRREAVRVAVLFPWILAINYCMTWILTEFFYSSVESLGVKDIRRREEALKSGMLPRYTQIELSSMVIFHYNSYGTMNRVLSLIYNSMS